MKVFQMNETETVVAKTKEEAIKYLETVICDRPPLDIKEITDIESHFVYLDMDHPDDIYGDDDRDIEKEMESHRISFKELIEKHSGRCPMHFTTEI